MSKKNLKTIETEEKVVKVEIKEDGGIQLNRVYYRKCEEGMQFIPDQSVDVVICDLPYGTTNNPWDQIIPYDVLWEQYNRIVKPEGYIILFSSEPFSTALKASNLENLQYDFIWNKHQPANFKQCHFKPLKDFEVISVFRPAGSTAKLRETFYFPQGLVRIDKEMKNKKGTYMGNANDNVGKSYVQEFTNFPKAILDFPKDPDSFHPTQKPVALIEYLIKTFSLPGGVVLDNCMGSFTTAIAALNTGRYFIGFETNLEYYQKGSVRLAEYLMNRISRPLDVHYVEEFYDRNEDYFTTGKNLKAENEKYFGGYEIEYHDDDEEEVITTEIELEDFDFEMAVNA